MVRVKHRYLLVSIVYPADAAEKPGAIDSDIVRYNQPTSDNLDYSGLTKALRAQMTSLFGDYGAGTAASLQVKYLSNATSTFILRASRAHHRLVWAALTLMDKVPCVSGRPCVFRVVRVSGTMRKVEDEVILRSRAMMQAAKDEMAGKSSDTLHALFGGQAQDRDAAMVDALDEGAASDEGEESDAG